MLRLFNTLSRKKEDFSPLHKKAVSLYSCGPTVYNYPHIGNYRAYIFADILRRTLEFSDYHVRHIMNLTDVDDKTIRDSQAQGKTLKELTEFYTEGFFQDAKALNLLSPLAFPKATDYIKEMVKLIQQLMAKGLAYTSDDGSVYYDIRKFKSYGQLSRISLTEQKVNASGRIKSDEYEKDSAQDFALWKAWTENDGDVFWETPLGKGRPGWHIECSAMSMAHFGDQLDIHSGGVDNIFPHHENEIAQSEGATGKPFVKYWLHNEWLLVDNKKMAKSSKNFYTLRDIISKGFHPLAYRYFVLLAHYRSKLMFSWTALEAAQTAFFKLKAYADSLGDKVGKADPRWVEKFSASVNDDLNTAKGLAVTWQLSKAKLPPAIAKATLLQFDRVLGLGLNTPSIATAAPAEVTQLVKERESARAAKDWALSDQLRQQIEALGFSIEDSATGPTVKARKK